MDCSFRSDPVFMHTHPARRHKCDGDHGGPPCADPDCWSRPDPREMHALTQQMVQRLKAELCAIYDCARQNHARQCGVLAAKALSRLKAFEANSAFAQLERPAAARSHWRTARTSSGARMTDHNTRQGVPPDQVQTAAWNLLHAIEVVRDARAGEENWNDLNEKDDALRAALERLYRARKAAMTTTEHPACKGMNCGITRTDQEHSLECQAEHAAAIAGGRFVKEAGQPTQGDAPSDIILWALLTNGKPNSPKVRSVSTDAPSKETLEIAAVEGETWVAFAPLATQLATNEATQGDAPSYTYASTQATTCASCGQHKHTPLRVDAMGGYVCLTCIDQKLGSVLNEFGYASGPVQDGWQLSIGQGHDGYGVYAHMDEYPEEGAVLLLALPTQSPATNEAEQAGEREALIACDAVCERIIDQDGGILGGVDFHALRKGIRAALQRTEQREPMTQAANDVLAERQRQIGAFGWDATHDDDHDPGELAAAASSYALAAFDKLDPASQGYVNFSAYNLPPVWPWDPQWFKPGEPRRMLEKAGALILAEIERLDRAPTQKGSQP